MSGQGSMKHSSCLPIIGALLGCEKLWPWALNPKLIGKRTENGVVMPTVLPGPFVVQIWSRDTLELRGNDTFELHRVGRR